MLYNFLVAPKSKFKYYMISKNTGEPLAARAMYSNTAAGIFQADFLLRKIIPGFLQP